MGRESLSQILSCFWDSTRPRLNLMQTWLPTQCGRACIKSSWGRWGCDEAQGLDQPQASRSGWKSYRGCLTPGVLISS